MSGGHERYARSDTCEDARQAGHRGRARPPRRKVGPRDRPISLGPSRKQAEPATRGVCLKRCTVEMAERSKAAVGPICYPRDTQQGLAPVSMLPCPHALLSIATVHSPRIWAIPPSKRILRASLPDQYPPGDASRMLSSNLQRRSPRVPSPIRRHPKTSFSPVKEVRLCHHSSPVHPNHSARSMQGWRSAPRASGNMVAPALLAAVQI